jgi:hypothetical protein
MAAFSSTSDAENPMLPGPNFFPEGVTSILDSILWQGDWTTRALQKALLTPRPPHS